jgi:hypothetical protein
MPFYFSLNDIFFIDIYNIYMNENIYISTTCNSSISRSFGTLSMFQGIFGGNQYSGRIQIVLARRVYINNIKTSHEPNINVMTFCKIMENFHQNTLKI